MKLNTICLVKEKKNRTIPLIYYRILFRIHYRLYTHTQGYYRVYYGIVTGN